MAVHVQTAATSTRKIKIGVVGCGGRGAWIAKLFQNHGGYDFHATADYFQHVSDQCGDALGADDWGHLIQPLGSGNFDVARLLAKLRDIGFSGPIGLQHYGIPGDARSNLQQSMNAWRTLLAAVPKVPVTPPPPAKAAGR